MRVPLGAQAADRMLELRAGQGLVLDAGLPHDVEALVESTVRVTLGWRRRS